MLLLHFTVTHMSFPSTAHQSVVLRHLALVLAAYSGSIKVQFLAILVTVYLNME